MSETCQLYLISPPKIADLAEFTDAVKAALGAGDVACLQLRLKGDEPVSDDDVLRAAEAVLPVTQTHEVALLINDRPDLALKSGADGVHVGQSDTPYAKARTILGDDAIVGVTCHNSRHLGLVAAEAGADYVAFGAFFATATKEVAFTASPEILEWWSHATTVPCVAIGGITPQNCAGLARAGADFLAVSSAVWNEDKGPGEAVKAFCAAISTA